MIDISVTKEFNSTKDLVSSVLEKYPKTRNSDTALFIQCCKELGATRLEDLDSIGLNIITIHKTRQVIQNKEGLYLPDGKVAVTRENRSQEIRDYMRQYA